MDKSLPHNSVMIALEKTEGGSNLDYSRIKSGGPQIEKKDHGDESDRRTARRRSSLSSDLRRLDAADENPYLEPYTMGAISEGDKEEDGGTLEQGGTAIKARLLQVDGLYKNLNSNLRNGGVPYPEPSVTPSMRGGFDMDTAEFDIADLEARNQTKLQQLEGALDAPVPEPKPEPKSAHLEPEPSSTVQPEQSYAYGEELSINVDVSRMNTVREGDEERDVSKLDDEEARKRILGQLGVSGTLLEGPEEKGASVDLSEEKGASVDHL
jgi:hypothetical protein